MACKNKKSLGVICMAHHLMMMNHTVLIFLVLSQFSTGLKKADEFGCSSRS